MKIRGLSGKTYDGDYLDVVAIVVFAAGFAVGLACTIPFAIVIKMREIADEIAAAAREP